MDNKRQLMLDLHRINAIKFGSFKLKSGIISPVYIDLRVLVSYPKILKRVARAYLTILEKIDFDRMAAIPYTALPIVSYISYQNEKPWLYLRKEKKDYGTKKIFEGDYQRGEKVVLIDDMITTGLSKIESVQPLVSAGLMIKDVVVLCDREQGGEDFLKKKGINLYSVFTLKQWLKFLFEQKKITEERHQEVLRFLNTVKK